MLKVAPRAVEAVIMKILVADDDPGIRGLLALQLGLYGHQVYEASDGLEALAAVARDDPDAVVLDVMMPELSGWDVLERLRQDERFSDLPVVIISARDVGDDIRHGYGLGANVVLPKPYSGEQLHDILSALVLSRLAGHQS